MSTYEHKVHKVLENVPARVKKTENAMSVNPTLLIGTIDMLWAHRTPLGTSAINSTINNINSRSNINSSSSDCVLLLWKNHRWVNQRTTGTYRPTLSRMFAGDWRSSESWQILRQASPAGKRAPAEKKENKERYAQGKAE